MYRDLTKNNNNKTPKPSSLVANHQLQWPPKLLDNEVV